MKRYEEDLEDAKREVARQQEAFDKVIWRLLSFAFYRAASISRPTPHPVYHILSIQRCLLFTILFHTILSYLFPPTSFSFLSFSLLPSCRPPLIETDRYPCTVFVGCSQAQRLAEAAKDAADKAKSAVPPAQIERFIETSGGVLRLKGG